MNSFLLLLSATSTCVARLMESFARKSDSEILEHTENYKAKLDFIIDRGDW